MAGMSLLWSLNSLIASGWVGTGKTLSLLYCRWHVSRLRIDVNNAMGIVVNLFCFSFNIMRFDATESTTGNSDSLLFVRFSDFRLGGRVQFWAMSSMILQLSSEMDSKTSGNVWRMDQLVMGLPSRRSRWRLGGRGSANGSAMRLWLRCR